MMPDTEYLSTQQVATRMQVTVTTVRHWITRGDLPALWFSGRAGYRISTEDLQQFVNNRHVAIQSD